MEPLIAVRHHPRRHLWTATRRGLLRVGDDVNGSVGLEDDLVQISVVGLTALSERFGECVGIEPGALEVAGEDVAVVDEQQGQAVDEVTETAGAVQDCTDRPVCGEQGRGTDEAGDEFGVACDHRGFHCAAQQKHHDQVDHTELGEGSASDGAQPDQEECEYDESMRRDTNQHTYQCCRSAGSR